MPSDRPRRKPCAASPGPFLRIRIPCDLAAVRHGAAQVRAFLSSHGLGEKEIAACELALVEGCNNAIQHTPPGGRRRGIVVHARCGAKRIELRINDHTTGFDLPARSKLPPPEAERGRGLFLMRALMDQVQYVRRNSGNYLVMRKNRAAI